MPIYQRFTNSERGDSFAIPAAYYNSDDLVHVGEVPTPIPGPAEIKLARHHIISWQIIGKAWNRCIDENRHDVCEGISRLLCEYTNPAPEKSQLCWAKRNLIIGPLGNHRLFDPGHDIDFESPVAMTGGKRKHVAAMVDLGKLMKAYGTDRTINADEFAKQFNFKVRDCIRLSGDHVCVFRRGEWNLSKKPIITWHIAHTGSAEVKESSDPEWHRGSYSPTAAMSVHEVHITTEEQKRRIKKMKAAAHNKFVQEIGS